MSHTSVQNNNKFFYYYDQSLFFWTIKRKAPQKKDRLWWVVFKKIKYKFKIESIEIISINVIFILDGSDNRNTSQYFISK